MRAPGHWWQGNGILALFSGLVLTPALATAEVRLIPNLDLEFAYTDNAAGAAPGLEDEDFYTVLLPSVTLNANGGRGQGSLRYGLSHTEYQDRDDLSSESHELLGTGRIEVWRQRVFLDVQAAMSRQTIARNGAIAASDRSLGSNQTEVFDYQAGLTKTFRHQGWVVSNSRLSFSQSLTDPLSNNPGAVGTPSDTSTYLVSHVLSSGTRFSQLKWNVTTDFEEDMISDGDEVTDVTAIADVEYPFNRFFAGIATAGYEKLDAGNSSDSSDGATWTLGGRLTPGSRTLLRVEYGRRYDGSYYNGDFSYQISPSMALVGSFRQDVTIQQSSVNNAFANLVTDDDGNFIDSTTGLPFSQAGAGDDLSEVDNVSRTRDFNLSLSGTRGRNTYGGVISWSNNKTRAQSRDQSTRGVNFNFDRELTPKANFVVAAGLSDTTDNTAADSTTANISASLDYRIGDSVIGGATLSYLRRNSRDPTVELDENTLSARLQITF